jgi:hypothetical protein
MVQNVDEHDRIVTSVGIRKPKAAVLLDGNMRVLAHPHIDAFDADVRADLLEQQRDLSVSAADVEHAGVPRDDSRKMRA